MRRGVVRSWVRGMGDLLSSLRIWAYSGKKMSEQRIKRPRVEPAMVEKKGRRPRNPTWRKR